MFSIYCEIVVDLLIIILVGYRQIGKKFFWGQWRGGFIIFDLKVYVRYFKVFLYFFQVMDDVNMNLLFLFW